jgi:tetratricopeptide (TPR) repeat protein
LYANALYFDRRYDDAIAAARTALAMQPDDDAVARFALQVAFISKGMHEEHLADQRKRIARDPERVAAFEQGLAEAGYEGAQRGIAELLAARYEKSGDIPERWVFRVFGPTTIALRYLDAGDYDKATEWLERAFDVRSPGMPYIGCSPLYDPLRSDPRFQDLLRRMNLPLSNGEGE